MPPAPTPLPGNRYLTIGPLDPNRCTHTFCGCGTSFTHQAVILDAEGRPTSTTGYWCPRCDASPTPRP